MSDVIIEKLLEQRDFYLNTLKHLDFQLAFDPTTEEIENIEKLKTNTINEIKKVEQEIAFVSSQNSS